MSQSPLQCHRFGISFGRVVTFFFFFWPVNNMIPPSKVAILLHGNRSLLSEDSERSPIPIWRLAALSYTVKVFCRIMDRIMKSSKGCYPFYSLIQILPCKYLNWSIPTFILAQHHKMCYSARN